jgi:hypothetical protein
MQAGGPVRNGAMVMARSLERGSISSAWAGRRLLITEKKEMKLAFAAAG